MNILLPIDLIDAAREERAVVEALKQAKAFAGEIHIISVIPEFNSHLFRNFYDESVGKEALQLTKAKMTAFCESHLPEDAPYTTHIAQGNIYKEILNKAEEIGADLIVMSASRPELADYLLGPNTAKVVRHARQSVLVVRAEG
ncbi:universal stress protein [Suttonella sp. R2A3]|uniref:universal stress protein n=1 Tax=Suttonella sp. R2A3 TaxID=2908648 RepID=UPI001F3890CD|nr:universal stress protein [Suttonella sp. R2A3]UJF25264.1 universal stress protein [Suttonella sp. R2A3]